MDKKYGILFLFVFLLFFVGCDLFDNDFDLDGNETTEDNNVTNFCPQTTPYMYTTGPVDSIIRYSVGPVESALIGGGKPDVAIDALGQPHIATQCAANTFCFASKIGGGWINRGSTVATFAGAYDSPDMAIDLWNDIGYVVGHTVTASDWNSVGTYISIF